MEKEPTGATFHPHHCCKPFGRGGYGLRRQSAAATALSPWWRRGSTDGGPDPKRCRVGLATAVQMATVVRVPSCALRPFPGACWLAVSPKITDDAIIAYGCGPPIALVLAKKMFGDAPLFLDTAHLGLGLAAIPRGPSRRHFHGSYHQELDGSSDQPGLAGAPH